MFGWRLCVDKKTSEYEHLRLSAIGRRAGDTSGRRSIRWMRSARRGHRRLTKRSASPAYCPNMSHVLVPPVDGCSVTPCLSTSRRAPRSVPFRSSSPRRMWWINFAPSAARSTRRVSRPLVSSSRSSYQGMCRSGTGSTSTSGWRTRSRCTGSGSRSGRGPGDQHFAWRKNSSISSFETL